MLYERRVNPIPNGGRVFDRISLITNKKNQILSSYVTIIFEDLCKVSYLQAKGVLIYDIFFRRIVYEIIIFIDNSALIDFPLIIMTWKQFMENNTIIFAFKNSYWLIIFTNCSISPFSIWRLPLGIVIKTLSDLGTNMKILLLLKVLILQHNNWGVFKHQYIKTNRITEVQTRAKNSYLSFSNSKKTRTRIIIT